jgi:hypothetical protein
LIFFSVESAPALDVICNLFWSLADDGLVAQTITTLTARILAMHCGNEPGIPDCSPIGTVFVSIGRPSSRLSSPTIKTG